MKQIWYPLKPPENNRVRTKVKHGQSQRAGVKVWYMPLNHTLGQLGIKIKGPHTSCSMPRLTSSHHSTAKTTHSRHKTRQLELQSKLLILLKKIINYNLLEHHLWIRSPIRHKKWSTNQARVPNMKQHEFKHEFKQNILERELLRLALKNWFGDEGKVVFG